jgi:exonuclease VII large subunit
MRKSGPHDDALARDASASGGEARADLANGWKAVTSDGKIHVYDGTGFYQGWASSMKVAEGWAARRRSGSLRPSR